MSEKNEALIRSALKDGCRAHCDELIDELRRLSAENERLAAEVANRNRRALAGDEAAATAQPQEPCNKSCAPGYCYCEPAQEPVAWSYELATTMLEHGYDGWTHRVTRHKPNAPEGSIRNLTPLCTAPEHFGVGE